MTFNWLLTFLQTQDTCLKYPHLKKKSVAFFFCCRQFLLVRAKLTSSYPPFWPPSRQVWQRDAMERPRMVAGQRAIYAWLSETSDWGWARRFFAGQHCRDRQSYQFVHPSHVNHGRGLAAKPTVYRWLRSEPSATIESPVSSMWPDVQSINIFNVVRYT